MARQPAGGGDGRARGDELPSSCGSSTTVQRGKRTARRRVDLAEQLDLNLIALDVGLTGDIPGPDARDFPSPARRGPIVVYQDASCPLLAPALGRPGRSGSADKYPVQRAIFQHYGSDGAALIRRGIETALLTYPTRYTHSPIETVDETDIVHAVELLAAFLTRPRTDNQGRMAA